MHLKLRLSHIVKEKGLGVRGLRPDSTINTQHPLPVWLLDPGSRPYTGGFPITEGPLLSFLTSSFPKAKTVQVQEAPIPGLLVFLS